MTGKTYTVDGPGLFYEINRDFSYWAQTSYARTHNEKVEWFVNTEKEARRVGFKWVVAFHHEEIPDLIGVLGLPELPPEDPQPRWAIYRKENER